MTEKSRPKWSVKVERRGTVWATWFRVGVQQFRIAEADELDEANGPTEAREHCAFIARMFRIALNEIGVKGSAASSVPRPRTASGGPGGSRPGSARPRSGR